MSISLLVGLLNLTTEAQNLQWTTVDPGGCETCTFELADASLVPKPGDRVRVFEGLTCIWDGRVEEPGDDLDARQAPGHVTAVGAGAALKDGRMSMVFMDRDLGAWQSMARGRQQVAISGGFNPQGGTVQPDTTTGSPSMETGFDEGGGWALTSKPLSEPWYDAGDGNLIARIRASWARGANVNNALTDWNWDAILSVDDAASSFDTTSNLRAAGPGTIDLAATGGNKRYAALQLYYAIAGGTDQQNARFSVYWTNLRIIGNHGITIRNSGTPAAEGFYPDDIVRYVAALVPGIALGVIGDSSSYTVLHSVYRTPTPHETPIDDMGKVMGWHWGVWPARSLTGPDTPVLDFRPPPSLPTAFVARQDCRGLNLVQRLSDFHDVAKVKYSDPAGITGIVTVSLTNPRLPAGISRTLDLDVGVNTAAFALQYGQAVLALEQQQTRAAGPVELPPTVSTPSGEKPSHMLQPGLDRLKITGLPNAGAWTDDDTRRYDTFRMQRLTCTLDTTGAVKTASDLDSGIDLLDVLMARLQTMAGISGA